MLRIDTSTLVGARQKSGEEERVIVRQSGGIQARKVAVTPEKERREALCLQVTSRRRLVAIRRVCGGRNCNRQQQQR